MNNDGEDDRSRHRDQDSIERKRRPLKKRPTASIASSDTSQLKDNSRQHIRPRLSHHDEYNSEGSYRNNHKQKRSQLSESRHSHLPANVPRNTRINTNNERPSTLATGSHGYETETISLFRDSTDVPFVRQGIRGAKIRTFASQGSTLGRQESPPSVSESGTTTSRTSNHLSSGQHPRYVRVVRNEATGTASVSPFARPTAEEANISYSPELNRIAELAEHQHAVHSRALNDSFLPSSFALNRNARDLLASPGSLGGTHASATAAFKPPPQPSPPAVDPILANLLQSISGRPFIGVPSTNREHQLTNSSVRESTRDLSTVGIAARLLPQVAVAAPAASLQPLVPPLMSISDMQQVVALATLRGVPLPALAARPPQLSASHLSPRPRTVDLYTSPADDLMLSQRQVLLRKQIEFFEVGPEHVHWLRHGSGRRSMKVSIGQVGIRCKHCAAALPPHDWPKGAVYFPSTLRALYQAAQNMGVHFVESCQHVDCEVQGMLKIFLPTQSGLAGKKYWADGARFKGVYETEKGLRFRR